MQTKQHDLLQGKRVVCSIKKLTSDVLGLGQSVLTHRNACQTKLQLHAR